MRGGTGLLVALLAQTASALLGVGEFSGTPVHAGLEAASSTQLEKHEKQSNK